MGLNPHPHEETTANSETVDALRWEFAEAVTQLQGRIDTLETTVKELSERFNKLTWRHT